MKALSLWQPWASMIAVGAKRIETRSWATPYRGPLAIQAAQKVLEDAELAELVTRAPQAFSLLARVAGITGNGELPRAAVVAITTLEDVLPITGQTRPEDLVPGRPWEREVGDYTPGRFAWILGRTYRLPEPRIFPGRRGLFELPDALLAEELPIYRGEQRADFTFELPRLVLPNGAGFGGLEIPY